MASDDCLSPVSAISIDGSSSPAATSPLLGGAEKRRLPAVREQVNEEMDEDNGVADIPSKKPRLDDGIGHEDVVDNNCSDDSSDSDDEGSVDNVPEGASLTTVICGEGSDCQSKHTNGSDPAQPKLTGKPCLLKANLIVKLVNNQLLVEMVVLGGQLSRDGGNQLLTFFKNKLQKRPVTAVK